MTSLHVVCGLGLPKSKIMGTLVDRRSPENFLKTFYFVGEHLRLCPWFLTLASSIFVLGLESVCPRKGCTRPWSWPRIVFVSLALGLVSSTPPLVIMHAFIAPRCDTIGVPLFWSFRTNVVLMVLSEN